jgi:hypothetical protein
MRERQPLARKRQAAARSPSRLTIRVAHGHAQTPPGQALGRDTDARIDLDDPARDLGLYELPQASVDPAQGTETPALIDLQHRRWRWGSTIWGT